jgi:hypothetical protein
MYLVSVRWVHVAQEKALWHCLVDTVMIHGAA